MSTVIPIEAGCTTCEYRVSGYCGNANPRCPNKPPSSSDEASIAAQPSPALANKDQASA